MEATQSRWQRFYATAKQDAAWQERRRASRRASYRRNRAKCLARSAAWAKANLERTREIWRKHYAENVEAERARNHNKSPEAKRRSQQRYEQSPKGRLKHAAKERKRNAQKRGSRIGPVDYAAVVAAANGVCGICKQLVGEGPTHIDHIVPLARGGSHTQDNLQLAHARCNISKGMRAA